MNILVILGHPNPDSLNAGIAQVVCESLAQAGHEVIYHDLCAEGFDPALPSGEEGRGAALPPQVAEHVRELTQADGIVVIHPNWWGKPPAVLCGWVDRVFRVGEAYEFVGEDGGEGVPKGLLKATTAVVLNTSNTYPDREAEAFGDPLERFWKDCVFGLCGVEDVRRRTFSVVCVSTPEQREAWLDEARALVLGAFGQVE
ncbi:MAG: NAD(P)H-dependent oxidoreductase [Proteobacteria bacterium]|nr:NAD(P)H-dependent oxidoreductase [Pseudomonadota bacterium]